MMIKKNQKLASTKSEYNQPEDYAQIQQLKSHKIFMQAVKKKEEAENKLQLNKKEVNQRERIIEASMF